MNADKEYRLINFMSWRMIIMVVCSIILYGLVFAKIEYNPVIMYYNSTGRIPKPGKIWMETVPITTANGQVVDISSAGFTSISSINVAGAANTTTITGMPNCVVKSNTLTSVTFNTTVSNSAVLAILQGLVFPSSTTGMTASVIVIGN